MKPQLGFVLAILASSVLGGCVTEDPREAPQDPPVTSVGDPHEILARLDLSIRPEGKRTVADLERFVSAAPRRFDNQFDHAKARDWLQAQFEAAGLQTERHRFRGPAQTPGLGEVDGENILGILPGRTDRLIIFGAHYDGAFNGYGAAYDDGGGTLIVVELARAMARYTWNHTLVFAAWDQEEAGLVGSAAYAKMLRAQEAEVTHSMNFDMTGINWPAKVGGQISVPLYAVFGGEEAEALVPLWKAAQKHLEYPSQSTRAETGLSASSSDHASFLRQGFSASWVHGALIGTYPMYHTVDTVETMIADVGGNRADLEAGFETVVQLVFLWTFLMDALQPTTSG